MRLSPLRRWLRPRFGLRVLLVVVTTIACWLAIFARRVEEQRAAVRLVRALNATVYYDFQERPRGSGRYDVDARPDVPEWLVARLGEDVFGNVVCLDLGLGARPSERGRKLDVGTEAIVARLRHLKRLQCLVLNQGKATDEWLRMIAEVGSLEHLAISDGQLVTDAGVAHLANLTRLRSFTLLGSTLTDQALRTLGRLPCLRHLQLPGCGISGKGLAALRGAGLQKLGLSCTDIGPTGLSALGGLPDLDELDLSYANVGRTGLDCLSRLQKLRVLDLSDNGSVGDLAAEYIGNIAGLESLSLKNTKLSNEGLRCLAGLRKLRILDVSENDGVDDSGLKVLVNVGALETVDLHQTNVKALDSLASFSGLLELDVHNTAVRIDGNGLLLLGRFRGLRLINVAGTGAQVSILESKLPRCQVIGSRVTSVNACVLSDAKDYELLTTDIDRLELFAKNEEVFQPSPEVIPLTTVVDRMLALTYVPEVARSIAEERSALETLIHSGVAGENTPETLELKLTELVREAEPRRRLYLAAVYLCFVDGLSDEVDYLEMVKQRWALTDVEDQQYDQTAEYIRKCLSAAGRHLGVKVDPDDDPPEERMFRLWEATRPPGGSDPFGA